jgi:hypothetical protein
MDNRRFELLEMSVWSRIQGTVASEFRDHFGISVLHDRDGLRLRAHRTRDLSLNRVYGLGVQTPLAEEGLDALIDEYRRADVSRFMVSWSTACRPNGAGRWFQERGFRRIPSVVRLARRTDVTLPSPCDLVYSLMKHPPTVRLPCRTGVAGSVPVWRAPTSRSVRITSRPTR